MNKLEFKHVNKKFGTITALNDFSLSIKEHELIVILGTSGSGKSTLLRIISGLENLYEGDILLNDKPLEEYDILERKVAMVFQHYALYPQMTAYMNLILSLKQKIFYKPVLDKDGKQRYIPDYQKIQNLKKELASLVKDENYKAEKMRIKQAIKDEKHHPTFPFFAYQNLSEEEINERFEKIKGILELGPFLNQRASTLSGGQKQRVALGKALLKEPEILLLDEPLSNLDAKLRANSRELIRKVHTHAKATTIVTSHDQNDAYALADRIVILDNGKIQQVGTIEEVYNHPQNILVARFLGNPSMNILEGIFNGKEIMIKDTNTIFPLTKAQISHLKEYINQEVTIGLRPENITFGNGKLTLKGRYEKSVIFGREFLHHVFLNENELIIKNRDKIKGSNQELTISFDEENVLFFDTKTQNIIE